MMFNWGGGSDSSLYDSAMNEVMSEIPYGTIFGYSILLEIAVIGGLFLGMWLVGKYLFKSDGKPAEYFNVAVVSQVPLICAIAAGLIISYISLPLGLLVMKLGGLLSVVCAFLGFRQVMGQEEDRTVLALPLAFLVMYLVIFIVYKIII